MEIYAYERDPFLRHLRTRALESGPPDRPWTVLEDTIFYPEGGGQPADRGWINGVPVVGVEKREGGVLHWLAAPLEVGPADLELDWERRFDHMQQHTAQHLLTAIAADSLGWNTTAFHLGETVSDIEIDAPKVSVDQIADLEERVASEIRNARTVRARRVPPGEFSTLRVRTRGLPQGHSGSVRLVEIEGVDLNTCGGTHLTSTAQIECLKILAGEPMRGGTKLVYVAGGRVRRRMAEQEARNARLRQLLATADENFPDAVSFKLDQLKDGLKRIRALREQLAERWAEGLAQAGPVVVSAHFEGLDMGFLQRVARLATAGASAKVCLLTASDEPGGRAGVFVVAAQSSVPLDLASAGASVAEILDGRGGGAGGLFQGKCQMVFNRDEALRLLRRLAGEPGFGADPKV